MPPEADDTITGQTDVSGMPTVSTPGQVRGDMLRKANRAGAPPKPPASKPGAAEPQAQGEPAQPEATPAEQQGGDLYSGLPKGQEGPGNPFLSGIDWKQKVQEQPWAIYHSGRNIAQTIGAFMSGTGMTGELLSQMKLPEQAAMGGLGVADLQNWHDFLTGTTPARSFAQGTGASRLAPDAIKHVMETWGAAVDPHAISDSIANIWSQNTAQAEIAKFLMSMTTGTLGQQRAEQTSQGIASSVLPVGANPLNLVGWGEGSTAGQLGYRVAAFSGPSLAEALGSSDPNQRGQALFWAALTAGMLSGGHLRPGVAKALIEAFGHWPVVERTLGALKAARGKYARGMAQGDDSELKNSLDYYLQKGSYMGQVSKMAGTRRPGQQEIRTDAKLQRAMFKSAGVGGMDQFLAKARDEGINDKRLINFIVDNYPRLGFYHDLERVNSADVAMGDPRNSLKDIRDLGDPGRTGWAIDSMNAFQHLLDHARSGMWAESKDGHLAVMKNLAGLNRTDGAIDIIYGRWLQSIQRLQKMHGLDGEQISKAIWGDGEAMQALAPEGQMIARQWRLLGNALMHESKGTGYAKDFIGNWLPFMFKERAAQAAKTGTGAVTTARKAHKIEQLSATEEDRLYGRARYGSASEANREQARQRAVLIDELTSPQTQTLRSELRQVAEAKNIQKLALTDPEAARKAAQDYARGYYGDFETDFFKIAAGSKARSLKAIRTHTALNLMTEQLGKDGNPLVVRANQVHQFPKHISLNERGFDGYLVHRELAPDLKRYLELNKALRDAPLLGKSLWLTRNGKRVEIPVKLPGVIDEKIPVGIPSLRALESKTVGFIMYSPVIHFMNLGSRMGTAWLMNPLEMTRFLVNGHAISPTQRDAQSLQLQTEWIESGGPAAIKGKTWMDSINSQADSALGNVDDVLGQTERMGQPNLFDRYQYSHQALNDFFWSWARDFGTMMYHLEKQAALRGGPFRRGMTETDARMWAGQRAKTWVGLTNPEDQNAVLHDATRLIMFAPEWWKSWGQLLIPVYRRSGMSRAHAAYAAYQGAKFFLAAFAFQKITGSLANYLLTSSSPMAMDGHLQSGNLPGNQDRIEATGGWLDHLPGFNQVTSTGKGGGRRTMENPLGRQMRDTEMAAGLESGHPGSLINPIEHPGDLIDGATKMAVSRLSPLLDGLWAALNVDLYRTMTTKTLAHVNPQAEAGPSPMSPLYMALMMSPMGSQWSQQMTQALQDPNAGQAAKGPFGAPMPKAAADMLGATDTAGQRMLLTWLTGVNSPYLYAERSRGKPVSDESYQKYATAKAKYQTTMTSLDAETLHGQLTPDKWLAQYRKAHTEYSDQARATFQDAPHYVNGPEGMLAAYEALYDDPKVKNADGTINYDLLQQEQAKFRAEPGHSQADLSRMDGLLSQQDAAHPMLGLYHKTFRDYGNWQQTWASQHNVDLAQLHREIHAYNQLYGNRQASGQYMAQHRELAIYEYAKKNQFERTPAGLMYGLFYDNATVMRYMQARHLTDQVVEQQLQAEP